ncbi:uncharacterized protein LOC120351928 [Nilaparvata lugens]|uniref:uncharacterized protein LOC120351928 n=1 Tax=Nilaparvata lugens TaxID=108931 RepID=UPI00193DB0DA|nr:uncharacterized protein LOC120351928 [Nilaparvata lugens]
MGGQRSGLLFDSVGNVLGLLVSCAGWYRLSLYLMDVVLGLAGDVVQLLSAFCGEDVYILHGKGGCVVFSWRQKFCDVGCGRPDLWNGGTWAFLLRELLRP